MLMNGDELPAADGGETTDDLGGADGAEQRILPPGSDTVGDGKGVDDDPEAEGEEDDDLSSGKFTEEQQKLLNRLLGKKNRKAREARKQAEEASREREELKKEAEALRNSVGDETVLKAASAAQILPEFLTKAEANAIVKVNTLKTWRNYLIDSCGSEGFNGQFIDGRNVEWTPDECQRQAMRLTRQIEDEGDTAREAVSKAKRGLAELLDLGRAAKKAGWKPGARPAASGTRTPVSANRTPASSTSAQTVPNSSTVRRSTSAPAPKALAAAYDNVKKGDKEALLAAIMADVTR